MSANPPMTPLLAATFMMLCLTLGHEAAAQQRPSAGPIKPAPGWVPPAAPNAPPQALPAGERPALRGSFAAANQDSFYDPTNPAFHQLQKANQALAGMPLDRAGFIDWMRLFNDGRIKPRASLGGSNDSQVLDLDIVLKNTKAMPWVRFPHRSHTLWLACANCHPAPFEQRAGAANITMESIFRGQWCGICHDRVAFITHLACERCHSVANPAARPEE